MTIALAALCVLAAAVADAAVPVPPPRLALGVAHFEGSAREGAVNLSDPLAAALARRGVDRVVAPDGLGAPRLADPRPRIVRALAADAKVDALVLGRLSQRAERTRFDVDVVRGADATRIARFVAEVGPEQPLDAVVDALADRIVAALRAAPEVPRPAPATAPGRGPAPMTVQAPPPVAAAPAPARSEPAAAAAPGGAFGPWQSDSDQPVRIKADELEASERDGERLVVFRSGVEVTQGDLSLSADHLEALYPEGAKSPQHLVAEGHVRVRRGERAARCQRAVYDRPSDRIVCTGHARLEDAGDSVQGDVVVFDLAANRVSVSGATELELQPEPEASSAAAPPPAGGVDEADGFGAFELGGDGPVRIRARELQASERDGRREVWFEGDVEVTQADVTLRSLRLDVVYPEGQSQPERLVATGEVVMQQGEREAHCLKAIYHHRERRIDCMGEAMLRDGDDQVFGELIEFDLEHETVVVSGGTRLRMTPGEDGAFVPKVIQ